MHVGSDVWILLDRPNESRTHRIIENVPRYDLGNLVVAQDVLECISLPQPIAEGLRVIKPRVLFRACDESQAVRRLSFSFNEEMQVIGHEAVRNDQKALFVGGSQNLR